MNDSPLASIIESAIRDGVEILNLHGLGLEELPPLFAELRSLRRLHLSGNRLRTVPAEVFRLVNLEVLDPSAPSDVQSDSDALAVHRGRCTRVFVG